jgi:hypothetical protein
MADESQGKVFPPYLPYKTLISSLENLGQGIPPKIDRSIWKNQPGTVQSQILSAYKFLGLMNEQTGPTESLKQLVEHRATPGPLLKKIITEKYSPILKHDLATMTTTMLNAEFEAAFKVEGETKKKGVRFFLQAAKANGFTLSKFLLDQTRVSAGPRKKRSAKREGDPEGAEDLEDGEEITTKGTEKTITLRSSGRLTISLSVDLFELSKTDRDFVFGLIDSLHGYEANQGSAHGVSAQAKEAKE